MLHICINLAVNLMNQLLWKHFYLHYIFHKFTKFDYLPIHKSNNVTLFSNIVLHFVWYDWRYLSVYARIIVFYYGYNIFLKYCEICSILYLLDTIKKVIDLIFTPCYRFNFYIFLTVRNNLKHQWNTINKWMLFLHVLFTVVSSVLPVQYHLKLTSLKDSLW